MLNMKVLDYRITSDADNVTVRRVVRNEKGEITYDKKGNENVSLVGYQTNLTKALHMIQRHWVLGGNGKEITTIREYQEAIEEITEIAKRELDSDEAFK